MSQERPETLFGNTVEMDIPLPEGTIKVFVTINYQEGRPYEVFINTSDPKLNEHLAVMTLLISRMLQGGFSIEIIAEDLLSIESAFTGHMAKNGYQPSIAARIGKLLKDCNVQPELKF